MRHLIKRVCISSYPQIAGHLLLKRLVDFEEGPGAAEAAALELLSQASLPESRFLSVAEMCFGSKVFAA